MIADSKPNVVPNRFDNLSVTTPCQMDWNGMIGDDRIRFCDLCQRNVYNLVQLSRSEIDEIWRNQPERVCARLMKDDNGHLITREKINTTRGPYQFSIFFLFMLTTVLSPIAAVSPAIYRTTKGLVDKWFAPPVSQAMTGKMMLMGDVAGPYPQPAPPANPPVISPDKD